MKTWDALFPDILPQVLGCPEPTVERHILRAAQDFCAKTLVWRVDLAEVTTLAQASQTITLPDLSEAVKLVGASWNGEVLPIEVADATPAADRIAGNVGDRRIVTYDLRTFTVMPTPAAGVVIGLTACLKPSDAATGLEDHIMDRFGAIIADGALATLLTINKAEWANTGLALDRRTAYERERNKVKIAAWKAYSNSQPRVRAQFF